MVVLRERRIDHPYGIADAMAVTVSSCVVAEGSRVPV